LRGWLPPLTLTPSLTATTNLPTLIFTEASSCWASGLSFLPSHLLHQPMQLFSQSAIGSSMASEEPRPAASARVVAMPRARVPRHLRQRTWEACLACRGAKRKCSGSVPCPPCVQRGMGSSCTIRSLRPVRRSTPETATTLAAVATAAMAAEFQAEPTRAPQAWLGTSMPSFTPRPLPEVSSPHRRYDQRRPSHSTSRPSGPGPIELTTSISPSESRTTDLAGHATAQTSPRMLRSSTGEQCTSFSID
jgi:hypothetical protein